MNKVTNTLFAIGLLAGVPTMAMAEEKMPEKPGVPSLADIMGASGVSVSGYVDAGYNYLSGNSFFTGGAPTRVYDRERNSFTMNMIDITVSKLPTEGFGGLVDLNFGPDANVNASAGTNANDETDIQAAYVHYASGPLMVIGGKFTTLAGAEVIKSPYNLNYSRSYLFGWGPFTHTGVRMTYAVNDKLSLIAGVNNGWDILKKSAVNDQRKTLELGFSAPSLGPVALAGSYYVGKEPGNAGVSGTRNFFDLVGTYNVTPALSFVVNAAHGTQEDAVTLGEKAKWWGVAGYANYKFSDMWRTALRLEHFDDKNGFRSGVTQKLDSATLTLAYMPNEHVELRGEVRADKSDKQSFLKTDGTAKDTQNSVGLQAIYKF